jgi:acyl carrier protein
MTNPGTDTIKATLADVLAGALGVEPQEITDDFSPEQCSAWDSVRHLIVVLAVEDRFGVTFPEEDIWSLFSLAKLVEAVEANLPA